MNHPSGIRGFFLEAHEKVQCILCSRPPIHDIAHLNEVRLPSGPMEVVAHQMKPFEERKEIIIVAVDIADGNELFNILPNAGDSGSIHKRAEKQYKEKGEKTLQR